MAVKAIFQDYGERVNFIMMVFGTNEIMIESPIPELVELEGIGPTPCFKLALNTITEEQFNRMVELLSKRFNLTEEYLREQIAINGVPIVASNCAVVVHSLNRRQGGLVQ